MDRFENFVDSSDISKLSAQEKIEFFRGKTVGYAIRVVETLTSIIELKECSPKDEQRVKEAFRIRVESHFASPADPSGGEHLSQLGVNLISEETSEKFRRAAAAIAGNMMAEVGYNIQANGAYSYLGKQVAKDYKK